MLAFFIFSVLFTAFFFGHFYYAYRTWKRLRGQQSSEIDQNYVRIENYFGQSFRQKVQEWLRLPDSGDSTSYLRTIQKGNELVLVFGAARSPDGSSADEILVVEGDFSCGRNSRFTREILVRRDGQIGRGSHLQAIAADGNLTLGPAVNVMRWADAAGGLEIRAGCRIRARASSATAIRLSVNVEGGSFYAPKVITIEEQPVVSPPVRPPSDAVEVPPPVTARGEGGERRDGFRPSKLVRISEDSWIYDGDLNLSAPLYLRAKLIVRGNCTLPSGSWLEEDIKVGGDLTIGETSMCIGNLVATGRIILGANSVFQGVIYAGQTLQLHRGVRGHRPGARVVAFAAGKLFVESNVVVQGKLASGVKVVVVATDEAQLEASSNHHDDPLLAGFRWDRERSVEGSPGNPGHSMV